MIRYGSVCSGVEAATLAWEPLGWRPVFFSEIKPFPCAVLHERYDATRPINIFDPAEAETEKEKKMRESWNKQNQRLPETGAIPNEGDFTKIRKKYRGKIDLLVGGTPCQDLSVAGKRAGFGGTRSCLAIDFIRLAYESGCKWIVWENVPGVFSSRGGGDFATFLSLLSGTEIAIPKEGFASAGFVCNDRRDRYGLAWRVLDAQFTRVSGFPFGIPQRRRRVFVVGYFGDWTRAAKVLLEPDRLQWNPPARIKTREILAGNACNRLAETSRAFQISAGTGRTADVSCTLDVKCKDGAIRNQAGMTVMCCNPKQQETGIENAPALLATSYKEPHCIAGFPEGQAEPDLICFHGAQDPILNTEHANPVNRNQGQENCIFQKRQTAFSIGNGQIAEANNIQKEVCQTLNCMHDTQAILLNEKKAVSQYGDIAGTLEARHDSSPCADRGQNVICETDVICRATQQGNAECLVNLSPTITSAAGMSGNNQPICFQPPVCYENHGQDSRIKELSKGVSPQLNAKAGTGGNNLPLVQEMKCYDVCRRDTAPREAKEVSPTLTRGPQGGNNNLPILQEVYPINSMIIGKEAKDGDRQTTGIGNNGDPCPTIQTAHHHAVAIAENLIGRQIQNGPNGVGALEECAYTQNCSGVMGVCAGDFTDATVRRLTPLECERLMGFPDNYTRIPYKGKAAEDCPDAPRYKACGNSMCVNVMRWIGVQIEKIEQGEQEK